MRKNALTADGLRAISEYKDQNAHGRGSQNGYQTQNGSLSQNGSRPQNDRSQKQRNNAQDGRHEDRARSKRKGSGFSAPKVPRTSGRKKVVHKNKKKGSSAGTVVLSVIITLLILALMAAAAYYYFFIYKDDGGSSNQPAVTQQTQQIDENTQEPAVSAPENDVNGTNDADETIPTEETPDDTGASSRPVTPAVLLRRETNQ